MSSPLLVEVGAIGLLAALAATDFFPPHDLWRQRRMKTLLFLLEAGAIVVVIYAFLEPILDFDPKVIPSGLEWENNTGLIALARVSILDHLEFPLWNTCLGTGIPYWGDPFVHLLNPLASLPALIIGAVNGPKLTMLLTMVAAAFAQYYLATVLGLRGPARLWAAILFGINGHMVERFAFGHYDFAISFPFIPLCFALLIQSLRSPNRFYPAAAGLANSLLFFSGNLYYTVYVIPGLLVTALFVLVAGLRTPGGWDLSSTYRIAGRAAAVVIWTLGFSAIQLLPYLEIRDLVKKDPDFRLVGSQGLLGSLLNLFRSDPQYYLEDSFGKMPRAIQEYYSYIGLVPLVGLPGLLVAWIKGNKWPLALLTALFLLYLGLASARHTPFTLIYDAYHWLYYFRGTYRALAFVVPFFILLSAFGFDALLGLTKQIPKIPLDRPLRLLRSIPAPAVLRSAVPAGGINLALGPLLAVGVAAGFFYGLLNPFADNQDRMGLVPRRTDHALEAQWFREQGPGLFYVSLGKDVSGGLSSDFYEKGIKRLPSFWGWFPILQYPPGDGIFVPRPKYLVLPGDTLPEEPDAEFVEEVSGFRFYRLADSPPYASLINSRGPPFWEAIPWGERAREVEARLLSPNVIEATADADSRYDTLLLLESHFPGWRVEVDGERRGSAENLGGFLSIPAEPGLHTYRFVYDPPAFRYGAAISLGTVLGAVLLLLSRFGILGRIGNSLSRLVPSWRTLTRRG